MEPNPYQSPETQEKKENKRTHYSYRRFKITFWEIVVVCWVITILLALVLPAVQTSRRLTEQERTRIEQFHTRGKLIFAAALPATASLTLVAAFRSARKRFRR